MSDTDGIGFGVLIAFIAAAIFLLGILFGQSYVKDQVRTYGCEAFMKAQPKGQP